MVVDVRDMGQEGADVEQVSGEKGGTHVAPCVQGDRAGSPPVQPLIASGEGAAPGTPGADEVPASQIAAQPERSSPSSAAPCEQAPKLSLAPRNAATEPSSTQQCTQRTQSIEEALPQPPGRTEANTARPPHPDLVGSAAEAQIQQPPASTERAVVNTPGADEARAELAAAQAARSTPSSGAALIQPGQFSRPVINATAANDSTAHGTAIPRAAQDVQRRTPEPTLISATTRSDHGIADPADVPYRHYKVWREDIGGWLRQKHMKRHYNAYRYTIDDVYGPPERWKLPDGRPFAGEYVIKRKKNPSGDGNDEEFTFHDDMRHGYPDSPILEVSWRPVRLWLYRWGNQRGREYHLGAIIGLRKSLMVYASFVGLLRAHLNHHNVFDWTCSLSELRAHAPAQVREFSAQGRFLFWNRGPANHLQIVVTAELFTVALSMILNEIHDRYPDQKVWFEARDRLGLLGCPPGARKCRADADVARRVEASEKRVRERGYAFRVDVAARTLKQTQVPGKRPPPTDLHDAAPSAQRSRQP